MPMRSEVISLDFKLNAKIPNKLEFSEMDIRLSSASLIRW
jgi:hypothetical protein